MVLVRLKNETDFDGWRTAARSLLAQGIAPEAVDWRVSDTSPGLFDTPEFVSLHIPGRAFSVSRDFIQLCKTAILYRDPMRFGLLYRLLWRLQEVPELLQMSFDPDVIKARQMAQAVRRDLHKMKAFVRFREIKMQDQEPHFVAWFEPNHHIVKASAAFFSGRFTNMRWSILTPEICMHWDSHQLHYSQGASKADAPAEDADEVLWQSYYRSIFNPARLKVSAMLSEMPKKYWRNLPEAALIADLIANADQRKHTMIAAAATEPTRKIVKYLPDKEEDRRRAEAVGAQAALYRLNEQMLAHGAFELAAYATQAVMGSGAVPSSILLLGEQPGEHDDLAGQPLTGPAGTLLDKALNAAGVGRSNVYVTNVLKYYAFRLQGTRRVARAPEEREIQAYLPWLRAEIAIVEPTVIIALGPVAARALTGRAMDMEAHRGKRLSLTDGRQVVVTYDPAMILRIADQTTKQLRYAQLVNDLALAAKVATQHVFEKS